MGCSKTGVNVTIKRWKKTGKFEERPGRGRNMKSTIRQDRALVRLSLSNRRLTSSDRRQEWRQSIGVEVSTSIIRKRLLRSGLRGCKAKKKSKVSIKQRKARIAWAKEHLNWTSEDWDKVIFSDESTFTIKNHAGNNFVRRRHHEAFSPQCISPTIKHPTSVMIWGCMALEDCTSVRG